MEPQQLINDIKNIGIQFSNTNTRNKENILNEVASILNWDNVKNDKIIYLDEPDLLLSRMHSKNFPLITFSISFNERIHDIINVSANYSYQTDTDWGVIFSRKGIKIFNSKWLSDGEWYSFPLILWDEIEQYPELINAITPSGLAANKLYDYSKSIDGPDKILLPVDDALVERLDYWRKQAVRYSSDLKSIDDRLQVLFAQLFVIRVVEDRKLKPTLATLESSIIGGIVDFDALNSILATAKVEVQSELYSTLDLTLVPDFIIYGIIKDLYYPKYLPGKYAKYNFAWIEADVLGRTYEKYLSTLLMPIESSNTQLQFWNEPLHEVQKISVQKAKGAFYTPTYLVDVIVNKCSNIQKISERRILPRIADFSCGSGIFLVKSVDILLSKLKSIDADRNWTIDIFEQNTITGIDIDKQAVIIARLALWLRLAEEPNPLPLPNLASSIICADALTDDIWSGLPEQYDVILGNPPYISAIGRGDKLKQLQQSFSSAYGRFDLSYLFVELAVNKLADGGQLGFVLPNRIINSRSAKNIRDIILNKTHVSSIVDFGSVPVFGNTQAYVAIILASAPKTQQETVVVKVKSLPEYFPGVSISTAIDKETLTQENHFEVFDVELSSQSETWNLIAPEEKRLRIALEQESILLSEISEIHQGIKTGANDLFIVNVISDVDANLLQVVNGLDETFVTERKYLRPVVFGSEISRYTIVQPIKFVIYPYESNTLVPEQRMIEEAPYLYRYLYKNKRLLQDRVRVDGEGKWYSLSLPRNEEWLTKPKILIRDLAMKPSFAVDITGNSFIIGGAAIVPVEADMLLTLAAYLNSKTVAKYLEANSSTYGSGFQKYEKRNLQNIPVPTALLELANAAQIQSLISNILSNKTTGGSTVASEAQIDGFISEISGVSF